MKESLRIVLFCTHVKDSVGSLVQHLREGYLRTTGRDCSSFVTKPGFGARGLTGVAAATGTVWPE